MSFHYFCGHRWIEDKKVAERALKIWPNISSFVKETLKKPRSKIPNSFSFATLRSAVQDPLIIAKLEFFASVASTMMPYLEKFQADTPLLPFVTTELTVLLRHFDEKVYQTE